MHREVLTRISGRVTISTSFNLEETFFPSQKKKKIVLIIPGDRGYFTYPLLRSHNLTDNENLYFCLLEIKLVRLQFLTMMNSNTEFPDACSEESVHLQR